MNFQRAFRRSISVMSHSSSNVSPFTRAVVQTMRRLYPESLADNSFDNTGLLLEAPYRPNHLKSSVLLTIDLTKAVADEAIAQKHSVIVAYHPIIFRGVKSLTQANSQQDSLLRLAQEGISVYCPHTAVDAVPGGLNDWLAGIVMGGPDYIPEDKVAPATISVITPVKEPPPKFEGAGYGRIVRFHSPQNLQIIVRRIAAALNLKGLSVAVPQAISHTDKAGQLVSSVGLCAGSGGSILNNLDVDLLFTGELSHHQALAAVEQGKFVITTFHSNTERLYLEKCMMKVLEGEVRNEMMAVDASMHLEGHSFVHCSMVDRDPYEIAVVGKDGW